MKTVRKYLARLKRKVMKRPYLKDKRFPGFWFDLALSGRDAKVVQIGSNDGKTGDPLYQLIKRNDKWQVLFVEPIPHYFKLLQKNYGTSPRFSFENVAITGGEQLVFYWVSLDALNENPDLPFWVEQLGSFDRTHIASTLDGKLDPYIISAKVECLSIRDLFTRNSIEKIDILHVDAEGHDWSILSQLNLDKMAPNFILFEYVHLDAQDLQKAYGFFSRQYEIFDAGIDLLCVLREGNKALLRPLYKNMSIFEISVDAAL